MWNTSCGCRTLSTSEWAVFAAGLDMLWSMIEDDMENGDETPLTDVAVFESHSNKQKLLILAELADALQLKDVPAPTLVAYNEAAFQAVIEMFRGMLHQEMNSEFAESTMLREMLFKAEGAKSRLPLSREELLKIPQSEWDCKLEGYSEKIQWDSDFEMADQFLDMPPQEARKKMQLMGIDPEYFLTIAPEPTSEQLNKARQTLSRLVREND